MGAYWKLGKLHATLASASAVAKDDKKLLLLTHAATFYTHAAKAGHAEGTFELAMCYLKGEGVARDKEAGMEYLRDAARLGHADAQRMVPPPQAGATAKVEPAERGLVAAAATGTA